VVAFSFSSGTFLLPSGVFLSPATAAEHKNQQKRQLQQKFTSPGFPMLLPTRFAEEQTPEAADALQQSSCSHLAC